MIGCAVVAFIEAMLAMQSPGLQPEPVVVKQGVWKSAGNAELLVIGPSGYKSYDLTSISCVETGSGTSEDVLKLYPLIESWSDSRWVVSGYDYRYSLDRISELPEPCRKPIEPDDALGNFDAFWQYFQENYAGFDNRKLDWEQVRREYRPRVKRETSERDLYAILGEVVEKINDPHVFLSNGKPGADNLSFGSPDPHGLAAAVREMLPGRTTRYYRDAAAKLEAALETGIRYELLHGDFRTAHNDRLTWGMITPEVGYLRLSLSVGFFAPGTSRDEMYSSLESTMEGVFDDLGHAKALVIDDTTNTGGGNVHSGRHRAARDPEAGVGLRVEGQNAGRLVRAV